jgi:hypothetical protein
MREENNPPPVLFSGSYAGMHECAMRLRFGGPLLVLLRVLVRPALNVAIFKLVFDGRTQKARHVVARAERPREVIGRNLIYRETVVFAEIHSHGSTYLACLHLPSAHFCAFCALFGHFPVDALREKTTPKINRKNRKCAPKVRTLVGILGLK